MEDIAKDANVSVNTVSRLPKPLTVSAKQLPKVLCIDDFKGNTRNYKIVEIRNALTVTYSNGAMEGYNNKIKVLKSVLFGFRNFTHFKARILLMANE